MTQHNEIPCQTEGPLIADGFTYLVRQALFTLTPFFMDGAGGDVDNARAAAKELLSSYQIGSAEELLLVAESIVFACAAMDTLRLAKIDPEIPERSRLRLHASAVSLNRASHRNRSFLDAFRKGRTATFGHLGSTFEPPASSPAHAAGPNPFAIMQDLREKIAQHRQRAAVQPTVANREQRRSAELAARREARRAAG